LQQAFWESLDIERHADESPGVQLSLLATPNPPTHWFLCRPLTLLKEPDPKHGATSLKPQFAALLCNLAKVRAHDFVLDPFCGSGTISDALEALNAIPFNADVTSSPQCTVVCNIWHNCWRGTFDAIVTDPPFSRRERRVDGCVQEETNIEDSPQERLAKAYTILDPLFDLARLLKPRGRLVFTFVNYPNLENAPKPPWETLPLRLVHVIPQRWVKGMHILERLVVVMEKT